MTSAALSDVLDPTADDAWIVEDEGCDPLRESSRESRFAVSNGFLGVRASRVVKLSDRLALPPRTYVAGLFDTDGPDGPQSALVAAADWLQLHCTTDGVPSEQANSTTSSHRLVLDMRRGMQLSEFRQASPAPLGVRVRTLHLTSRHTRAIGLQVVEMSVESGEAELRLEAFVDQNGLALVSKGIEQNVALWRTKESGKSLGMAVTAALVIDGEELAPTSTGPLRWSWVWNAHAGQTVSFERIVALSRGDDAKDDARTGARTQLDTASRSSWRGVLADHEAAWSAAWDRSDVVVEGDAVAQQALRFAVYHLIGAADPTDERVSIGARALTGEDYHGHVFWDTEIYLVPFYTFTWPEAARALLMYRFHTLAGARTKAQRMGWRGALYAWESAETGDETAPAQVIGPDRAVIPILAGQEEQHISADVAYAVWQYWKATGDDDFLLDAGAEILLETARFWLSRAVLEADGFRHIRGVIGPDEYHETIDDNAFTNVMARWNIRRALDVVALLSEKWPTRWSELAQRIDLVASELARWLDAAEKIVTGLDATSGIFEQFAGYSDLEQIDLAAYAGRSVPMDVVLGRERTQRSQVIKQADVVALLALLPEEFPGAAAIANFRYYEPRCAHGSSLSRAMHAVVAARLGERDLALRYFDATANIDLCETHAAIAGGIHIAAQGGVWMTAVYGFAGFALREDGVAIEPALPDRWDSLRFRAQWRGRRLEVSIDRLGGVLDVTLASGEPMKLYVRGKTADLAMDRPFHLKANC